MRILTGIKPTGEIHLGNYAGAISPAVSFSNQTPNNTHIFLIADLHSAGAENIYMNGLKLAATFIALGASNQALIIRQSDVPEITQNMWLLSSLTNLGMLYRAHAYKARVAGGLTEELLDASIFMYPVLMASDILTLAADEVFVGSDQSQHIEITRDLVNRFNLKYNTCFTEPVEKVVHRSVLPGTDGRKMSKSYGNTIPIWGEPSVTRKLISRILTDSSLPGEPKPEDSPLFKVHSSFLDTSETEALSKEYANGIGWGKAKKMCFEDFERKFAGPRDEYKRLLQSEDYINKWMRDSVYESGASSFTDCMGISNPGNLFG